MPHAIRSSRGDDVYDKLLPSIGRGKLLAGDIVVPDRGIVLPCYGDDTPLTAEEVAAWRAVVRMEGVAAVANSKTVQPICDAIIAKFAELEIEFPKDWPDSVEKVILRKNGKPDNEKEAAQDGLSRITSLRLDLEKAGGDWEHVAYRKSQEVNDV